MGKLRVRSSTSDRSIDEHDASENNLTWMQKASHRPTLPVGMLGQAFTRTSENISSKPGPKKKQPVRCPIFHFGGLRFTLPRVEFGLQLNFVLLGEEAGKSVCLERKFHTHVSYSFNGDHVQLPIFPDPLWKDGLPKRKKEQIQALIRDSPSEVLHPALGWSCSTL